MPLSNFERMIQLANDVFAAKSDPDQLDVDENVMQQLQLLHPATISEYDDGNGPVTWILVIPTTTAIMEQFLTQKINEKELLSMTPTGAIYTAVYLCSALVLDEYRHKGIAQRLAVEAILSISKAHPIEYLFVWPFTPAGNALSEKIAKQLSLPLKKRAGK